LLPADGSHRQGQYVQTGLHVESQDAIGTQVRGDAPAAGVAVDRALIGLVRAYAHRAVRVGDVVDQDPRFIGGKVQEVALDHYLVQGVGLCGRQSDGGGSDRVGRVADVPDPDVAAERLSGHGHEVAVLGGPGGVGRGTRGDGGQQGDRSHGVAHVGNVVDL